MEGVVNLRIQYKQLLFSENFRVVIKSFSIAKFFFF